MVGPTPPHARGEHLRRNRLGGGRDSCSSQPLPGTTRVSACPGGSPRRAAQGGCRGPGAPEPFVGRQYVDSATSNWTFLDPCDASPRLQPLARGGPRVPGHPVHAAIHPLRGPISTVQLLTAEPMTKRTSDRRGARRRLQPPTGRQIVLKSAPSPGLSAIGSRRKGVVCAQGVLRPHWRPAGRADPRSRADGADLGFRKQQVLGSNPSVGSSYHACIRPGSAGANRFLPP